MKALRPYQFWPLLVLVGMATTRPFRLQGQPRVAQSDRQPRISGRVVDASGNVISGATVKLRTANGVNLQTVTDADGLFTVLHLKPAGYTLTAEARGLASNPVTTVATNASNDVRLVLRLLGTAVSTATGSEAIAFSDQPNFVISGVTDWTAVGGHGSDVTLRTSEDLARATSTLKSSDPVQAAGSSEAGARLRVRLAADPKSFEANLKLGQYLSASGRYQEAIPLLQIASAANHKDGQAEYELAQACDGLHDTRQAKLHIELALAQKDSADYQRLAGALDEKLGDPYGAVKHMERATQLDPREENYFVWASELLLHRAVTQAADIFQRGVAAYPASVRMRTGLGSALFAGASYELAAQRLCEASDLKPTDVEPYLFLGRVDEASPTPLPCVQERLARFLRLQPNSAAAHYYYGMALLRREGESSRPQQQALLSEANKLDAAYAPAYLQLGILAAQQRNYLEAIKQYRKSIAADATQVETHYRLALAYDRTRQPELAKQERELYQAMKLRQENAVEQERRAIKQFVVIEDKPAQSSAN